MRARSHRNVNLRWYLCLQPVCYLCQSMWCQTSLTQKCDQQAKQCTHDTYMEPTQQCNWLTSWHYSLNKTHLAGRFSSFPYVILHLLFALSNRLDSNIFGASLINYFLKWLFMNATLQFNTEAPAHLSSYPMIYTIWTEMRVGVCVDACRCVWMCV